MIARPDATLAEIRTHMKHDDFQIGQDFWCGGRRWRCTDIGTRVVVAICLDPHEIKEIRTDPDGAPI